ncbi:MAG: STAS domain-containing protein [Actinomycetota bacterium]|nr:STAS domain-containing protein [Actinomycetota bacterium]
MNHARTCRHGTLGGGPLSPAAALHRPAGRPDHGHRELDRAVAHRLADALAALPLTGHSTWTVDAAGLSFCDAEGLRVIAAGAALAESRGCTLRLVDPSPFVTRLLGMVGMAELIDGAVSRDAGRSPLGAA